MTTLFLGQFAKENLEVVFVHNYPGLVKTDVFGQGWGATWPARRVRFTYIVMLVASIFRLSEAEVDERIAFPLSSV